MPHPPVPRLADGLWPIQGGADTALECHDDSCGLRVTSKQCTFRQPPADEPLWVDDHRVLYSRPVIVNRDINGVVLESPIDGDWLSVRVTRDWLGEEPHRLTFGEAVRMLIRIDQGHTPRAEVLITVVEVPRLRARFLLS